MQSNAEHKMTSILLVGLSHRTAPIAVREQLSLDACSLPMIASALQTVGAEMGVLQEVVLLSTCNRLEVYATSCDTAAGVHFIRTQIAQQRCVAPAELECYLYTQTDGQAVNHLMRVAAGLDSLILGEAQILGQVATAFAAAQSCGSSGPILARLFSRALHCGKRARTETPIGNYTTSISHAAVRQAEAELGDLSRRCALVIGAGEMAELAATALQKHEIASIVCINRTLAHAEQLAMQVGGRAVDWSRLDEALAAVDLVISATAAPHIVLSAEEVAQVMPLRAGRPLLLFDIALPRDIDTGVDALPDIARYDIDHLRSSIDANIAHREAAIPLVESIIATETEAVFEWFNGREVLSTVIELRRQAESIAQQEVARTLQRLLHQTPAAERIEHEVGRLAERIVAKLLHEPTVRLKAQAASGNGAAYAQTLSELFALEAGDVLETKNPALTVNGGLHHSPTSKEIVVFENGACSHD